MRGTVLHAVSSAGFYGIERMLGDLLPALQAAGQPAALLSLVSDAPTPGERQVARAVAARGVPTLECRTPRGFTLRAAWRIARILRAQRPAAVHPHGYKATILVGAVARAMGIPVLATVHSEAWHAPELRRALRVEAAVLRRLSGVVAVSAGVAEDLVRRGVARDRILVVPNGIHDPAPRLRLGHHRRVAIVLGRLIPSKGVHVVLEAVAGVIARAPDVLLVVAGEGPEEARLRADAARLGIDGRVRFAGHVAGADDVLAAADIFVMASRSEGMPMAVLEAMAHAVPIVATAVGGIPSMVRDGEEAILVPVDAPTAVRDALLRLIEDCALADRLAAAARARFLADFTAAKMADAYIVQYASLR